METWEFSGNLDSPDGILNYDSFVKTVNTVMSEFCRVFTPQVMHRYPLLIDNATSGSGHTPIITPVLNEFLIIKMHIKDGLCVGQTIYQIAHELTHLVLFSINGLNKQKAKDDEESLCVAASLCMLKTHATGELKEYINYVDNLSNAGYRGGTKVAMENAYSLDKLKDAILSFAEKQQTVL